MSDPTFTLKGTQYTFKPLSGPLEETPRPKIFSDIGYALASWARMEHLLTTLVIHINKQKSSAILHDPDPSSKFAKLLGLYGKWLGKHSAYAHLKTPHDKAFFTGLFEMAKFRNALAHGVLILCNEATGKFRLLSLSRIGVDTWKAREDEYEIEALKRFSELTNIAHRRFIEVAELLFEKVDPPQSQSGTP